MSQPWLSVIMPTYNGAAYLAQTLASIVAQLPEKGSGPFFRNGPEGASHKRGLTPIPATDSNIEVIAVDDGSTDATLSILNSYSHHLPLRILARGRIGNWVANTNYGLAHARGQYACFLHQDDLWLPGRLRVVRRLLAQHRQAALLFHASRYIDQTGRRLGIWRSPLPVGTHSPQRVVEQMLVQNFIAVPAPVFKREDALRAGGLDETLWYTADWDFWLKLAQIGTTVYTSAALAAFRIHALSQTAQGVARAGEMRRQIEVVLDRYLPVWDAANPGRAEVGQAARMSVAINSALATCAYGDRPAWSALARDFLALGPAGWQRYFRDSRIVERLTAQVRARTQRTGNGTAFLWPRNALPQAVVQLRPAQ